MHRVVGAEREPFGHIAGRPSDARIELEIESVLETLAGFEGRIPSVVQSLYPPRPSPVAPRPDVAP